MTSWLEEKIEIEKQKWLPKPLDIRPSWEAMQAFQPETPEVDVPQLPQRTAMPPTRNWTQGLPRIETDISYETPVSQPAPQAQRPSVSMQPIVEEPTIPVKEETELKIPFWQRALQVFSAPFEWVDENIIKPTLAVGATGVGAIEEVGRLPGEDFFEWKKRSWEKWEAPGVDIKVPWGDGDIRIDIKGIMEFAPWLLLPGAGQVGTAARAGFGVAGILGKAGRVGKTLGAVIEYSPWGLVEKGTGAIVRGAVKGVSKTIGKGEAKLFGEIPQKEISPAVKEITTFFKEQVIPLRKQFEKELPRLRSRQEAAVRDIQTRFRKGEITATETQALMDKATAGGIKQDFAVAPWDREAVAKNINELLGEVLNATERGLVARDTAAALHSLALKGELPEPHHIREFARVFGKEFAESVSQLKGVKRSKLDNVLDVLNIPRAVLASGDISAVARQGLILGLVHPTKIPKSFGRMIKSLFSEKLSLEMDDVMRADPMYNEFTQVAKGYIAPIAKGSSLSKVEESFASKIAESFPFVRRSERAFITYLNELRFSSYKAARNSIVATGGGDKELQILGRFINLASGRGDLPKALEKYAPTLNTILFSPRLQAATLELPVQLGRMFMSKNPYMRKEAAKALVTFVGGGTALLMLLKNSGAAKVEFDPRSGDFGKIVIGDKRLDIWRGYAQYGRFMAQMLTGQKKSAYGNMSKKDRFDTAFRFLQSKSSPALGLLVDMTKGETYMGDPLFEGTTGTIKTVRERMMPLAVQDIIDAVEQSGINGLGVSAPALLGVGALTYIDEYVKTKDKIAREMGFGTWDEIDPKTQKEIWNRSVELQAAQIQLDRRVMDTAWGEWRLAGNAIEDVFKEQIGLATEQFKQTGDGYKYRTRINDAFTARRGGYDAREKDERFKEIVDRYNIQDTAEALIALSPEQMAIRTYNDALYGDDMYDEFGEYRFDEAKIRKEQLQSVLGEEMYNYVEEYQGVKYETFPPEFQEFQKAKELLAPYWEVRNKVEKMFGKSYAESSWGQRMITKLRQQMRMANPEMNKYYNLFYKKE